MQDQTVKTSAAVMGAITALGTTLLLFSENLPDVALAAAASVAISGFVTLVWLLTQGSRPAQAGSPQVEAAPEQLRVLLEDTKRLRAQTEELHRHLIDALDESVSSEHQPTQRDRSAGSA